MAKTQTSGRGGSNFIAAGVAVLAVALFMGWLATREPDTAVGVTEPGGQPGGEQATDLGPFVVVPAGELVAQARVNELLGQQIRIDEVEVSTALGEQLFWLNLPGGMPLLAKLSSELVAEGQMAPSTGHFDIIGVLHQKPEELLAEWLAAGVLRNENDHVQALYGSSYIEARRLSPAAR